MSLPSELIPESVSHGNLGGSSHSNNDLNQHGHFSLDASFQFHNSGAESTIFLLEAPPATATSSGTYGSTPLLSRSKGYKVRMQFGSRGQTKA